MVKQPAKRDRRDAGAGYYKVGFFINCEHVKKQPVSCFFCIENVLPFLTRLLNTMNFRNDAYCIYQTALTAVHPSALLSKNLYVHNGRLHIGDRVTNMQSIHDLIVIAAGKAASAMSKVAEQQLGNLITGGICITKYNHALELARIKTMEAGHPVPDGNSILGGKRVLELVKNLSANDIVLLFLSGGASSLLADLPAGCGLAETQHLFSLLVNSGASIAEINIIRKHLSGIKGGHLAKAAYPANIFTLIISDVAGDDPSSIASGPTAPDPSTYKDAYNILVAYEVWSQLSRNIKKNIYNGLNKLKEETPGPGDPVFETAYSRVIGNNQLALEAAKHKAGELGYQTIILQDNMNGNTEYEARKLVQFLLNYKGPEPVCFLAGGETTLQVTGNGKGGRNQHFALCALDEFRKQNTESRLKITLLSAGTDGTDGPTDAAGAIINNELPFGGTDLQDALQRFDAYPYFEKRGGLLKTGPTQTNVMDMVIALLKIKK